MALSGSFKTSGYTSSSGDVVSLLFSWTAQQDIGGNTSTISWTLKGNRAKSGKYVMAGGFKVVIDGDTEYSKSTDYRIELYNDTEVHSGTKTIKHNNDGTRSFTVYVEGGLYYYAVNCKGTQTFTLDAIPRASTVTFPKSYIGSNPTIVINSASPNFTHTLLYRADYKGYGADGLPWLPIVEKTNKTTITDWTIPNEFYATIPNDRKASIWIECITYNGNAEIGRVKGNWVWYLYANEAECIPDVFGTVIDVNPRTTDLTGDPDVLIRGKSEALCRMSWDVKNYANTVIQTINGISIIDNDGALSLENVTAADFEFYVEDSRGYKNTFQERKTIIPYIELTANATAKRKAPTTGEATITIKGNYYKGGFGAGSNYLKIRYRQGEGKYEEATPTISDDDNTYTCTIALTGLDYEQSFDYEVQVEDALQTIPQTITIGKGIPVFDWGENDFNFNVPVTIKGVNILEKLAELEELVAAKG